MKENQGKTDVGFQEALRRIANTPKDSILNNRLEQVANKEDDKKKKKKNDKSIT